MLRCEISKEKTTVCIVGDIMDIQCDTCTLIKRVHDSLKEIDKEQGTGGLFAQLYKDFVKEALYNITLADEDEKQDFSDFLMGKVNDIMKAQKEQIKKDLREADN